MPWYCLHCDESVADNYAACWACGAARDGTVDSDFQHADLYEPPVPETDLKYILWSLLRVVTALCLVFAFMGSPNVATMILGLGAFGWLLLHLLSWASSSFAGL